MKERISIFIIALILCFTSYAGARQPSGSQEEIKKITPIPNETSAVSKHKITLKGVQISYTASAGTLLLKEEDGTPKGSVFFIAYTRDGVKDPATRPLTFSFNGGPGAASVWVHLGAFGPKKVLLDDEGMPTGPPPGKLVDNEFCPLDVTDFVFIDPISTGYSRAVPGEDAKQFHGFHNDIKSVGEFIRLYITKNGRWSSPKFLAGESYGSIRSAGLAGYLQNQIGMFLNGVVLISCALNKLTNRFFPDNDLSYILFLPSYTATAWYHGRLSKELSGDLRDVLNKAEKFALSDYTLALLKGDRIEAKEREEIIKKVALFTGLSEKYVKQSNLRIKAGRFFKELLRDEGKTVGRMDGRYTGRERDSAGESVEFDSSALVTEGMYVSLINDYLRNDLGYECDYQYNYLANVWPWSLEDKNFGTPYPQVTETLRSAIHKNPYLRVLVMSGYYDMATPYFAAKYVVDHLNLSEELRENVRIAHYEAGHMMYLRKADHKKFHEDFTQFIRRALKKNETGSPSISK